MFPVFSLVLDQDVKPEVAILYPELYKDLTKVRCLTSHLSRSYMSYPNLPQPFGKLGRFSQGSSEVSANPLVWGLGQPLATHSEILRSRSCCPVFLSMPSPPLGPA